MSIQGWYYLHENGELIYKRDLGYRPSKIWGAKFPDLLDAYHQKSGREE